MDNLKQNNKFINIESKHNSECAEFSSQHYHKEKTNEKPRMFAKIDNKILDQLIQSTESSILDFKAKFYDFSKEEKAKSVGKFLKDVLSFVNTQRDEDSFILFGIKEQSNGVNEVVGISSRIDEASIQEIVKDKAYPRPKFHYYELMKDEKRIGVLHFPIVKYEHPIAATRKYKGIEVGKIYFRNGSSNTEANGLDTIRISDWFRSLPSYDNDELSQTISLFVKRISESNEKLSSIISDILIFAKNHGFNELINFCKNEMQGYTNHLIENHKYRVDKIYITLHDVEINPYSNLTEPAFLKAEMQKDKKFVKFRLLFNQPLLKIEEWLGGSLENTYAIIKLSGDKVYPKMDDGYEVTGFIFESNVKTVYSNIRQKVIQVLTEKIMNDYK